jgi:putative two-component system response regulator
MHDDRPDAVIADDEQSNLILLEKLCQTLGWTTRCYPDGEKAVQACMQKVPDVIILDIRMPICDGFDATRRLRSHPLTAHIPVIAITGYDAREDRITGIRAGVNDYITKPVDLEELSLRLRNNLEMKKRHDLLIKHREELESQVQIRTAELTKRNHELVKLIATLDESYLETVQRMVRAAGFRDVETGAHILRIGLLSQEIAKSLGMDSEFCQTLFHSAPLHDLGKIGIPDSILLKKGTLNVDEWKIMQEHPRIGSNIMENSVSPYLKSAEIIARTHHERFDGTGYPSRLQGDHIPLEGRIVKMADEYDALRSQRPYKPPMEHQAAMNILQNGDMRTSPSHFDPEILRIFVEQQHRFQEIYESHRDPENSQLM